MANEKSSAADEQVVASFMSIGETTRFFEEVPGGDEYLNLMNFIANLGYLVLEMQSLAAGTELTSEVAWKARPCEIVQCSLLCSPQPPVTYAHLNLL